MSEKLVPLSKAPKARKEVWLSSFGEIIPGTGKAYSGKRARTARIMYYYLKNHGKLPVGLKIRAGGINDSKKAWAWVYMDVMA